jgi:SAM-dependent methyltransferase
MHRREGCKPRQEASYWDEVIEACQETRPQTLWRVHSDAVHVALFTCWLPFGRVERLLKTDLFDEALSDGLYPLLASRTHVAVGMDISVLTIHAARSRYTDLRATGADVRCLHFADGVFDVVVSNSTLDHFKSRTEITASLLEIRRVLRAGGQLLLTLDNLANPVIALRNALPFSLLNRWSIVPYYIGATYGPWRLQRALREVGLEVFEVSAIMHCPRVFAVAMACMLEKHARPETQRGLLRLLMAFERLSHWPTRFLTGHFVVVKARKP